MNPSQHSGVLHHVGIVLPDFEEVDKYLDTFDHSEDYRGYVECFECWCIFLKHDPGSCAIELVIPNGGPLARYNKGFGGLHHYAILTADVALTQRLLASKGIRMTQEKAVKGAGDFLCNFVHPATTRGFIVEYIELLR